MILFVFSFPGPELVFICHLPVIVSVVIRTFFGHCQCLSFVHRFRNRLRVVLISTRLMLFYTEGVCVCVCVSKDGDIRIKLLNCPLIGVSGLDV